MKDRNERRKTADTLEQKRAELRAGIEQYEQAVASVTMTIERLNMASEALQKKIEEIEAYQRELEEIRRGMRETKELNERVGKNFKALIGKD